jgi:hypothetical protein
MDDEEDTGVWACLVGCVVGQTVGVDCGDFVDYGDI